MKKKNYISAYNTKSITISKMENIELKDFKNDLLAIIHGDQKIIEKYIELKNKEDIAKKKFLEGITKENIAKPPWGYGPTDKAKWYLKEYYITEKDSDSMVNNAILLDKIYALVGKNSSFQKQIESFRKIPPFKDGKFSIKVWKERYTQKKKVLEEGKFSLLLHAIGREAEFECRHTFSELEPKPNWPFLYG